MTAPRVTRREVLIAGGLIAGGYAIASLLQASAPLGRDVSGNRIARAALIDPDGPSGGAARGDLAMAVYTDYRCPACRSAHAAMHRAVADDGGVRLLYKDYPIFGAVSDNAAALAIAAHFQGLYVPLHDRLMTGRASVDNDDIEAAVIAIGGDWQRLQQDRATHAPAIAARLGRIATEAFGLGIAGTPAYLIGSYLVNGALDAGEFAAMFRQARGLR